MPANQPGVAQTLDRILALDRETEWIEFKVGNEDPQEIGEYISALGNSAALEGRRRAYLIWGIRDADHTIVGTHFDPDTARAAGEELTN